MTALTLRRGMKGAAVFVLQRALNAAFQQSRVGIDGDFGTGTYAAVIEFQRRFGLGADGVVGPATWAKLDPYVRATGGRVPIAEDSPDNPTATPGVEAEAAVGTGLKAAIGVGIGIALYWLLG